MSKVEVLQATPGYREDPWSLTLLSMGMCVGWLANYIGMIYKSFQDRTYSMALMPLCCNVACEFVYAVIYPPNIPIWRYIFASWLALNCGVAFAAIKFAPNEWEHAPLVKQNISWIFAVSIAGWMAVHLAVVAQFGPIDAPAWSSWFCQLFLSAGCLCQLLVRGSSRGTSLLIWFSRFIGTVFALPFEVLRYQHGYTNVVWHSPLGWLGGVAFFLLDGSYGIILWNIRRSERKADNLRARKTGSGMEQKGGEKSRRGRDR